RGAAARIMDVAHERRGQHSLSDVADLAHDLRGTFHVRDPRLDVGNHAERHDLASEIICYACLPDGRREMLDAGIWITRPLSHLAQHMAKPASGGLPPG